MNTNLQEFKELSIRAFYNTSFDPEKRGAFYIKENEIALLNDLEEIEAATGEEKERYIKGFKNRYSNWMSAKSRCISSMITGGSNFPVRRAEKANASEHNRSDDFYNYRVNVTKAILKAIKKRRPKSEIISEDWQRLEKGIFSSAATIINIDLGIERRYSRALFVSSIYNKVNTYAKNGNLEIVKRATQLIRNLNEQSKKPVISERHKFFKLEELTEVEIEKKADLQNKEDKEIFYNGFKVVVSFSDERIKIIHEEKPERSIINNIKEHGFRWAFKTQVWQRKLTNNALYVTFKLLLKEEKQIVNS